MAFTIKFHGGSSKVYDDDHDLEVKDSGVLQVLSKGEQVALYSPSYWTSVKPGKPKPQSAVRIY